MRTDLFSAESLELYEINEKYDKVVNEYLNEQHDSTLSAYDKE
ncbi:hypothetical protein [Pedobacter steynii]